MSWSKSFGPGSVDSVIAEIQEMTDPSAPHFSSDNQEAAKIHEELFEEAKESLIRRINGMVSANLVSGDIGCSFSGHGGPTNTNYSVTVYVPNQ